MSKPDSIPPTVKVGGTTYQVRVAKELPSIEPCVGLTDLERHVMWISTDCSQREAMLHEVVHTAARALGLEPTEREIDLATTIAWAIFKDNPSLVAWLGRGGK